MSGFIIILRIQLQSVYLCIDLLGTESYDKHCTSEGLLVYIDGSYAAMFGLAALMCINVYKFHFTKKAKDKRDQLWEDDNIQLQTATEASEQPDGGGKDNMNHLNGVDCGHEKAKNQSNRFHGEDVDDGHNIKHPIPIEMNSDAVDTCISPVGGIFLQDGGPIYHQGGITHLMEKEQFIAHSHTELAKPDVINN